MFICRGVEYLGIEYLSTCLKSEGHVTDLVFDPGFDDTFYFRAPFLKGLNRWPSFIRRIKEFKPDVLAVSSVSNTYPYINKLVREIKETYRCYTIIGGVHASLIPEYIIREGLFDAVCVGEGELATVELLRYLEEGERPLSLKNFYFLQDREVIKNPLRPLIEELDDLPFLDKDIFYKYGAFSTTLTVMSGRGCPFSCTCCINDQWRKMYRNLGTYIRRYSPERMVEEIEYFTARYPIKRINFQDDVFVVDRKWLARFAELYLRSVKLPFQCNVHTKFVSDETTRLLKTIGCASVCLGIQTSAEEKRRKLFGRPETNEEIKAAVALFKKYRLPVYLEYIFGLPNETEEDIVENLKFNQSLQPTNTASFVLYAFLGTPLLKSCQESKIINDENLNSIRKGEGSVHYRSFLQLPNRAISETAAALFPLLTKLPKVLARPLIRIFSKNYLQWLRLALQLLSLPINNSFQFIERVSNYFSMFRHRK